MVEGPVGATGGGAGDAVPDPLGSDTYLSGRVAPGRRLGRPRRGGRARGRPPAPASPRRDRPRHADRPDPLATAPARQAVALALLVAGAPARLPRRRPAALPAAGARRHDRRRRPDGPAAQPRLVDQRLLRRRGLVRPGGAAGRAPSRGAPPARRWARSRCSCATGWSADGGGGIWWRRGDDFKNAPANGPAAILLARGGHVGAGGVDRRLDARHAARPGDRAGPRRRAGTAGRRGARGRGHARTPTARASTSGPAWRWRRSTVPPAPSAGRPGRRRCSTRSDTHVVGAGRCRPRLRRRRRRGAVQRHPGPLPGRRRAAPPGARARRPRGSCSRARRRPGRAAWRSAAARCSPRTGAARPAPRARAVRRRTCRCSCRRGCCWRPRRRCSAPAEGA